MRPLVVDASAALAYLRDEPGAEAAERAIGEHGELLVPTFFWAEVVNVLARRHRWPGSQVLGAVYDLEQLGFRTEPFSRPHMLAMIDAVEAHGLSACDAQYLVLAESAAADLLTGDARLASAAGSRAIDILRPDRIGDREAPYSEAVVEWPGWPGAAAYIEELRRELSAGLETPQR